MSDIIFSSKTREKIYTVLVEIEVHVLCYYNTDDLRDIAFNGVKGIKEYTDQELYRGMLNTNQSYDRVTNGSLREHELLEIYKLVEVEYGIYKILKEKAV